MRCAASPSVALAGLGYEVVGLEPSAGAAAVARARGVHVVEGSAVRPGAGLGVFDTIVLLGNNLGLLGSREQAPAVLASLAALARPGTRLLGSGLDPYATETDEHRAYHTWNEQRDRFPGQVTLRVRDGTTATAWFDYLFLSLDELVDVLRGSPWVLRETARDDADYAVVLEIGA
jgi:SAM-dependent methyltransferase